MPDSETIGKFDSEALSQKLEQLEQLDSEKLETFYQFLEKSSQNWLQCTKKGFGGEEPSLDFTGHPFPISENAAWTPLGLPSIASNTLERESEQV